MSRIDINQDKHLTVWRYSNSEIYDTLSACEWIVKAAKVPSIEVDYYTLRDLTNRNDEGNTSSQLSGKANLSEMYGKVQEADIDIISMTGAYQGKLIVIGVDLRSKTISVTLNNSNSKLIDDIETLLQL